MYTYIAIINFICKNACFLREWPKSFNTEIKIKASSFLFPWFTHDDII